MDSATGSGVVTNTTGDVRSGVSVNVHDAAGGAALQVKGQTRHVEQSGNLTSQSLTSAVVDVANWIGNTKSFGSRLNGVTVTQKGTRNVGELKVGVEGQVKPGVNLWGNIGQQMGGGGYSDTSALLGVKVSF